jgi:uncharacterized membrane protein YgdD (TMEM256/DUF423 family)
MAMAMGAIGAHVVATAHLSALVEKAAFYQVLHSVLLLYLSALPGQAFRIARWLCCIGIMLFCGSLYLKGMTGIEEATILAPLGGMSLMATWLVIAFTK